MKIETERSETQTLTVPGHDYTIKFDATNAAEVPDDVGEAAVDRYESVSVREESDETDSDSDETED